MSFEIERFGEEGYWFYDWLETNSVGSSSICLWFALLHTWHKAGCPVEFAVAISTLEVKTGLKKDAICRARNKLKQAGRIDWSERKGNQSAVYRFVSFKPTQSATQMDCVLNNDAKCNAMRNTVRNAVRDHNNNRDRDNINQDKDIVSSNTNVPQKPTQSATQMDCVLNNDAKCNADPFRYYEQHFGLLRPLAISEIQDFIANGLENKLICKAIDRSFEYGASNWAYARSILDKCVMRNIFTLSEFYADEERHKKEQVGRRKGRSADGSGSRPDSQNEQYPGDSQEPQYGYVVE